MSSAVCYSMQYGTGIDNCADGEHFSGYQWSYFASLTDNALRARVMSFITSTNWYTLVDFATRLREEERADSCRILDLDITTWFESSNLTTIYVWSLACECSP